MADERVRPGWRIIGETVPGASHVRAGIPNQDAIFYVRESSRGLPIVLSISDGHGSPKCFRSDRGSRFAVKKAAYLVSEFLDEWKGELEPADIESRKDYLSKELVKRWREAVEEDLRKQPFTEKEFENLEKKSDAKARNLVEENPLLAYGATSLTIAVAEDFILYLQLGDGSILKISETGEVAKPLEEDARLIANETTSLCLPKAEKDFRFLIQRVSGEESPAMILLSTDGYLNSFSNEAGFFQAGTDILEMLKEENGFDAVNDNLRIWLEEATRMGSGDDCTLAVIYRPDKLKKSEKKAELEKPEPAPTESKPAAETLQSLAAPADSNILSSGNTDDVGATTTTKEDQNTKTSSSIHIAAESTLSSKNEKEKDKEA